MALVVSKCSICQSNLKTKSQRHLEKHEKLCAKYQPFVIKQRNRFKCSKCNRTFKSKWAIFLHLSALHFKQVEKSAHSNKSIELSSNHDHEMKNYEDDQENSSTIEQFESYDFIDESELSEFTEKLEPIKVKIKKASTEKKPLEACTDITDDTETDKSNPPNAIVVTISSEEEKVELIDGKLS